MKIERVARSSYIFPPLATSNNTIPLALLNMDITTSKGLSYTSTISFFMIEVFLLSLYNVIIRKIYLEEV